MKIVDIYSIASDGEFPKSSYYHQIKKFLTEAILKIEHPQGTGKFSIFPGKHANGVVPIKQSLMLQLKTQGWNLEYPLNLATRKEPGKVDAALLSPHGNIIVEWETGNISSSHRAINKMCLGLLNNVISAGILIVPSRGLYPYLTDRIGNFSELEPYFEIWERLPIKNGALEIIVVEHDEINNNVPALRKGTDGRALR
ncbi:hypothetical protein [Bilophila wadsworthia]